MNHNFHELSAPAKAYLNQMTDREKRLLFTGFVILFVCALFFTVVNPLKSANANAHDRLAVSRANLQEIHALATKVSNLKQQAVQHSDFKNLSFDSFVSDSATNAGIKITAITKQNTSLQIKIAPVGFNRLTPWLTALEEKGVRIKSLEVSKTEKPGIVDVKQLRLSAGDQ